MAKRWYIVQAYSNFERKVAESIREKIAQNKLQDLFEDVIVPTEKVVEVRRGRKVDAERKFFPGYVLVKMDMTNEAFHLIKNIPKVTGFLGSSDKPMPISEKEAMAILQQVANTRGATANLAEAWRFFAPGTTRSADHPPRLPIQLEGRQSSPN